MLGNKRSGNCALSSFEPRMRNSNEERPLVRSTERKIFFLRSQNRLGKVKPIESTVTDVAVLGQSAVTIENYLVNDF